MPSRYPQLDLSHIRLSPLAERPNKVRLEQFGRVPEPAAGREFLASLPDILAATDFRRIVHAVVGAVRAEMPVILCLGAHVIKVGCSPHIIELVRRGVVTALATNGAGAVHDVEIALIGETSEDVAPQIEARRFGMARETGAFLNGAAQEAAENGLGLGEATGARLLRSAPEHVEHSILAACYDAGVPATVHVAIGTDITHSHPDFDGAAWGAATHTDFRIFGAQVARLQRGGVLGNIGSAVMLPVVIEKAIAAARNLGHDVGGFTGFTMDFIRQYRAGLNPVTRAHESGGFGATIIGHHEIMVPLLVSCVLAQLEQA